MQEKTFQMTISLYVLMMTYFIRDSITVRLVYSLIGLDLNKQEKNCYLYVLKILNPNQSNEKAN